MIGPSKVSITSAEAESSILVEVDRLDNQLYDRFQGRFQVQPALTRLLVSFQANKTRPIYRWYKYKEAFSASLIELLCQQYEINQGKVLDPFAGSGTTLFAASGIGLNSDGIELLPIGQQIIDTKKLLDSQFTTDDFNQLKSFLLSQKWKNFKDKVTLPELRITKGAYSQETRAAIEQYLRACLDQNIRVQAILRFALLCVLESISYTRKDGQYLRWDYRSGRGQGKQFNKGEILELDYAITAKINEIINDLEPSTQQIELFPIQKHLAEIRLHKGSCLDIMPGLPTNTYDAIITSPPYCNRYDYTRTYALELALLGITEKDLTNLRQQMLSCTVENRSKDLLNINQDWKLARSIADSQMLLQATLKYLEHQKSVGKLNNNGIPRMVRGYFYEMACVMQECLRVLKPGGYLFMVNDNVRYAGASISVDLILSDFSELLGFVVENILVLPGDKGNSSQQMGNHGRDPLRKCVYIWKKP